MTLFDITYDDFKREDTTNVITITLYTDDKQPITPNSSHTWKAKVSKEDKYVGEYPVTISGNTIKLSSSNLTRLPNGDYGLELWETYSGSTTIYPSAGVMEFRVHRNANDTLGTVDPTTDINGIIEDLHKAGQNIKVVATNTLSAGSKASVTQSITNGENQLTFNIPQGNKGDNGDTGPQGVRGYNFWVMKMTAGGNVSGRYITDLYNASSANLPMVGDTVLQPDGNVYQVTGVSNTDDGSNGGGTFSLGSALFSIEGDQKNLKVIINKNQLVAPYDNLNTLPNNTVVTYAAGDSVENIPQAALANFTVYTFGAGGNSKIGSVQLLASQNGSLYWRASWNYGTNAYYDWQNLNQTVDNRIVNNDDQLNPPYTDLDTLPVDSLVAYAAPGTKNVNHLPDGLSTYNFTIETKGYSKGNSTGAIQELITTDGDMYYRIAWGWPVTFQTWHKAQQSVGQTNALEYKAPSLSLFNNFAVIGDSYSAGSMQLSDGTWVDSKNNQWGLMLARKYGTNYTSFAKGGASAGTFLWDTLPKLKASEPQDIYYLILGINDSMDTTKTTGQKLGTPDDMHDDSSTNPGTFYGNYAKIIDAVKAKAPNAKIIMFTIMAHTEFRHEYDEAIKTIADHYKLVVADVSQDPLFDSDYYINHMKGGHPTAPLYAAQAEALERVIQKTIVDNPEYFSDSAVLKY